MCCGGGGRVSPSSMEAMWLVWRGADLLVLDDAPLEMAGRVVMRGVLIFDDDPAARVAWQADTRVMYLDEQPLQEEMRQVFKEARLRGR
jgi:hypothetical protein